MAKITYRLELTPDAHLDVKIGRNAPNHIYVPGKTRAQLTRDVLFILRVSDVPVNKDRLQNELDAIIWNYVPKRDWY
jgi:hypothetical protein